MTLTADSRRRALPCAIVFLALVLCAGLVQADDRDLLRTSTSDAYVQILLDTSGSMHWTPPCSEEDATNDIDPWDGTCTSECTLGDAKCAQVCPDFGCIEYDQDATATTPIEILVEDTDPAVTATGGFDLTNRGGHLGGSAWETGASETGTVTFPLNVPQDGEYHVYVYYRRFGDSDREVETRITHLDGTTEYVMDQRNDAYQFNYLGTYDFSAGTPGELEIVAEGDGRVVADTVRLWSLPAPAGATCAATGYRCQQTLCPEGDCRPDLGADDPSSKFYQAKQALYEVLDEVEGVNFGFNTFEQDNARVLYKHFLYRVPGRDDYTDDDDYANSVQSYTLPSGYEVPAEGARLVFGTGPQSDGLYTDNGEIDIDCETDDEDEVERIACTAEFPADVNDPWEMKRFYRVVKGGSTRRIHTYGYLRDLNGEVYRIDWENLGSPGSGPDLEYGNDSIDIHIDVSRCLNDDCTENDDLVRLANNLDIELRLVSEYTHWNIRVARFPQRGEGFFDYRDGVSAGSTCNGFEENDDWNVAIEPYDDTTSSSDDDAWFGYTFKFPAVFDPRGDFDPSGNALTTRTDVFDDGDWLRLDWSDPNVEEIQARLAPNTRDTVGEPPDFRFTPFFRDDVDSSDSPGSTSQKLRLRDEDERPLVAFGSTPLARSLEDFADWYEDWDDYGRANDPDWACRQRFVLLLTDGDDTCSNTQDACDAAATLLDSFQIKTFVVGFGLPGGGDALTCMAEDGGTGEPLLPRNKDELVEALRAILVQVKTESRSFASASIPAVQSTAADKVYLSQFVPVPDATVWPGQVDVFRQPLPLTDDRRPDTNRKCTPDRPSGCHLYNVGDKLLEQAPTEDQVNNDPQELRIGSSLTQRRVFYGQENTGEERPGPLRLLRPVAEDEGYDGAGFDRIDLAEAILPVDDISAYYTGSLTEAQLDARLRSAVGETLRIKNAQLVDNDGNTVGCDGQPDPNGCTYVLGDIFHADPRVLNTPNDFSFFQRDYCGQDLPRGTPNNCNRVDDGEFRGYREFVRRNVWRRRMLVTANNDGQLHFFDAGRYREVTTDDGSTVEVFDDGTGIELFSYMPRLAMPAVGEQAFGDRHVYSLDGSVSIGNVFIDPVGDPDPEQREWRTLMIGSMREGGDIFEQSADVPNFISSYYALDVTTPDELETQSDRDSRSATVYDPYLPADTSAILPTCLSADFGDTGRQTEVCQTLAGEDIPFPAQLWTFADTVRIGATEYFLDEERQLRDDNGDGVHDGGVEPILMSNGVPDLGQTWSQPIFGQVAVCEGSACDFDDVANGSADDITTRWVAIIGGGIDGDDPSNPVRGTFLYMLDVETGKAIYKRQLQGSAPANPAAIDVDEDGLIDQIYIGTTNGVMYKVDLNARDATGDVPSLERVNIPSSQVLGWDPVPADSVEVERVVDSAWDPFPIYKIDAPIYYAPSLFRIPERGTQIGLAFGVGERHDLWLNLDQPSYFVVTIDENFTANLADAAGPGDVTDLPVRPDDQYVFPYDDPDGTDVNLLLAANGLFDRPGWVMTLPDGQRATSEAFLLIGILVFTTFEPVEPQLSGTGTGSGTEAVCARTGETFRFIVDLANGNSLFDPEEDDDSGGSDPDSGGSDGDAGGDSGGDNDTGCSASGRCETIGDFTTAIHIDRTATKNAPVEGSDATLDQIRDERLAAAIRESILDRMPRSCTFNERFSYLVSALRSDT
ncbi:MAG: hypothetical protein AAGN46_07925, partial [Acidobacteriota bacterium]